MGSENAARLLIDDILAKVARQIMQQWLQGERAAPWQFMKTLNKTKRAEALARTHTQDSLQFVLHKIWFRSGYVGTCSEGARRSLFK